MAFKKAFGAAAMPVAGVSALAVTAAIGYFVYTGAASEQATPTPVDVAASIPQSAPVSTTDPAPNETAQTADTAPAQDIAPSAAVVAAPDVVLPDTQSPQTAEADGINTLNEEPAQDATSVAPSSEAADTDTDTADTQEEAAEQEIVEIAPAAQPTFDLVRIVPDGFSTVAGLAGAGAEILVMVDGAEVGRAKATASGEFVALFELESSPVARELQLLAISGDTQTQSASSIIVAPRAPAAAPEVSPEPELSADNNTVLDAAPNAQDVETQPTELAQALQEEVVTLIPEVEALASISPDAAPQVGSDTTTAPEARIAEAVVAQTPEDTTPELEAQITDLVAEPELPQLADVIEKTAEVEQIEVPEVADVSPELATTEVETAELKAPKPEAIEPEVTEPNAAPVEIVAAAPTPAPQPRVLKATDEGVQVLDLPRVNDIIVDAITYDPQGAVFASGRAVPGSLIRLYVDNTLVAQPSAGPDGQWRSVMDVATGRYILRADMIDADGSVKSRIELPFQREDIDILAQVGALGSTVDTAVNSASGSQSTASPQQDTPDPVQPQVRSRVASITVQPGNTLWGIASDTYGDGLLFARVFEANEDQIRDPDLIYPGQVFVIPE